MTTDRAGKWQDMTEYQRLIQKLQRIEALFAGATTQGERVAAGNAMQRILAKAQAYEQADPAVEHHFSLKNTWSRRLFVALLRRYGIRPYRYHRQRYTTVMAVVSPSFVKDTLWPEFEAVNQALHDHLDAITRQVVQDAMTQDTAEIEEVPGKPAVKLLPEMTIQETGDA